MRAIGDGFSDGGVHAASEANRSPAAATIKQQASVWVAVVLSFLT